MGRRKREPKFSKARYEYVCITCGKKISKGEKYVVFTYISDYLKEAFKELTKYYAWANPFEVFISLRFCSGRCYRKWERIDEINYHDYPEVKERIHKLEIVARNRRLKGWKNWVVYKKILEPFDNRWKVREEGTK